MWQKIRADADIARLMERFNHFHDSVIREIHAWSGYWAPPGVDGRSSTDEQLSHVRILFQRHDDELAAIELLFSGVDEFHWIPTPPRHIPDMYWGTMRIIDDLIYWTKAWPWEEGDDLPDSSTWIGASMVHWREVAAWGGPDLRYGAPVDLGQPEG